MLLNRPAAFRENETEIREAWKLLMKRDNLFTSDENTLALARECNSYIVHDIIITNP